MPSGDGAETPVIRSASGVWMDPALTPRAVFRETVGDMFDARVESVDLSLPETASSINAWVADQTEGRIETLVPGTGTDAALLAAAATYFKGAWALPFDPDLTKDGLFAIGVGRDDVTVPMMTQAFPALPYRKTADGADVVVLTYAGDAIDMTVILPPPDADRPDAGAITAWLDRASLKLQRGTLTLPRLAVTSRVDFVTVDGVDWMAPLTMDPDLSGIARGIGGLGSFLHAVALSVDESGTEAASASAAVFNRGFELDSFSMTVDRPFLICIRHVPSDAILFVGHIGLPSDP